MPIEDIRFDKKVAIKGFILNRDKFTNSAIAEEYEKYCFRMEKKILADAFSIDSVEMLKFYIDNGKINKKNFDSDYFQPAQNANAIECIAYLLDWKDKNISFEDEMQQLKRELNKDRVKDPFNAADMKKIWLYSILKKDGTIEINEYKGKEENITIPGRIGKKAVTSIADQAFSSVKDRISDERENVLKNLKSVTIPDTVKYIGSFAFECCLSLINVFIGKGVKRIGTKIFCSCYNLTEINVDMNNKKYTSIDGVLYNKDKTKLLVYPPMKKEENFVIPDSVTSIGEYAFEGCEDITNITLSKNVTSIEDGAFKCCEKLTDITLPNGITRIGEYTFCGCKSLTSIIIPNSVTSIEGNAFSGCEKLEKILIPPSVKRIEVCVFQGCKRITIFTTKDSYAAKYARENDIKLRIVEL